MILKIKWVLLIAMSFSKAVLLGQSDTCVINTEIGISFPPVSDQAQRDFTKIHLDTLGIKKIRFAEDWSNREPTQGNFNWGPLDARISWATSNNYEVLLTIQSRGPSWACGEQNDQSCVFSNNAFFQTYIDTLLTRYPNQIAKIQFGNEWQSDYWYAGDASEFVASHNTLYNSVQSKSPNTAVVLGGFTTISLRFLAACNGYDIAFYDDDGTFYDSAFFANNCNDPIFIAVKNRIDSVLTYANYDYVDLHLYDDVALWPVLYENFMDTISKPAIVSEFGGPNMNVEPYSESYQAAQLYTYIKVLDSLEISEAYYFKLVEGTANTAHSTTGLIDDSTLLEKPAYYVVKSFQECIPVGLNSWVSQELKFYPNPAESGVTLEYRNPSFLKCEIIIHNANGQLVYQRDNNYKNNHYLRTRSFKPGLYFVTVKTVDKMIGSGKLVIK